MEKNLVYISVDEIYPHPQNPRKNLGELDELAESIKNKGVMQNLTVVPRLEGGYTVIIGHRRLSASKLAGLTVVPCVITDMSEREQLGTMLLENMQRSDLNVYEQAQGFQLMMDFGETVESISEKTGFSKNTVRRRLKMAELDQDMLLQVSDRQISLVDFDRLAQIEDIKERNECLKDIGTSNFNMRVNGKVKAQNIKKKLPYLMKEIKRLKAKKLTWSETYGGKYDRIGENFKFFEWEIETEMLEKKISEFSGKLYYYLNDSYGEVSFYKERPKAPIKKRPQAEIDREKYISETRGRLQEISESAYELRKQFIESIHFTSKNADKIYKGALLSIALHTALYVSSDSFKLYSLLGISTEGWDPKRGEQALKKIKKCDVSIYPKMVYNYFGDKNDLRYFDGSAKCFPTYYHNMHLDAIYDWLISLGYEMSDDERKLRDGTHELLIDKDSRI